MQNSEWWWLSDVTVLVPRVRRQKRGDNARGGTQSRCTSHATHVPRSTCLIRPVCLCPQGKAKAIASAKQILNLPVFKLPDIAVPTSLYESSFAKNWTLCANAKGREICSNQDGEQAPLSAEASATNEATLLKRDHRVIGITS